MASSTEGRPYTRVVKRKKILVSPDESPRKRRTIADDNISEILASSVTKLTVPDTVDNNKSSPAVYTMSEDEILEDRSLDVPGETDWSDDANDDMVPIRVLSDFSLYHRKTMKLIFPLDLVDAEHKPGVFGASGIVSPWTDEHTLEDLDPSCDDAEEDHSKQRIQLSGIVEFNIHDHDFRRWMLDDKIYVRTKFAWYILAIPNCQYQEMYQPYWIQHQVFHLVISAAMRNPDITYDEFVGFLSDVSQSPDASPLALDILGRHVNEEDFEQNDVRVYVLAALEDFKCRLDVPLIRHLLGAQFSADPLSDTDSDSRSSYDDDAQDIPAPRLRSTAPKMKSMMKNARPTVVSEIVGRIANQVYNMPLHVVRHQDHDENVQHSPSIDMDECQDIISDRIQFVRRAILEEKKDDSVFKYYEKANVNGVLYSVGDTVLVKRGCDTGRKDQELSCLSQIESSDPLTNMGWFAKICFFFSKKTQNQTKYLFHGQWFFHSSKTIIQEAENPQELFLSNQCDYSIPMSRIMRKVSVRRVDILESPPQSLEPDQYYYAFIWASEDAAFIALPTDSAIEEARLHCHPGTFCYPCALRQKAEHLAVLRRLPEKQPAYSWHGVNFHCHDFVYVKPAQEGLYDIAQITYVEFVRGDDEGKPGSLCAKVSLLMFDRLSDPHQILPTSRTRSVYHDTIDGLCYVLHLTGTEDIDEWVRHPDHFFVAEQEDIFTARMADDCSTFPVCGQCLRARIQKLQDEEEFRSKHTKLRSLELFSGAGGLGTGYAMSSYVDTRWAVELSSSAAASYQSNHPQTIVYNVDSSDALQNAIDQMTEKDPFPLRNRSDGSPLPWMPKPGEVDFIYGGPPCQAFSFANWNKRVDDIRSTLICNTLAYLEHYRPEYFQLENVVGLLNYRLQGRQEGRCIVGGIQNGVVKFICRTLTALGYQCRFKVLQAAQYGVPQSRERLIFWAARRDVPLPEFPIPTHFYQKAGRMYKLPTVGILRPVTRSLDPKILHQCAPLPALTVEDAIGDLPPFEWKNPYQLVPPTIANKVSDRRRRNELGIPSFEARHALDASNGVGYTKAVPYAHAPMTRYQSMLRAKVVDNKVKDHNTKGFSATVVERVVNIPMIPNANLSYLTPEYWSKSARTGIPQRPPRAEFLYRRINGEGQFMTALTLVAPNSKGGPVLHPSQKRLISVRECARAQGFPDHYEFLSMDTNPTKIIEDQHCQIGNAVPVPLALALGQSLGAVLMKKQKEENERKAREASPEC